MTNYATCKPCAIRTMPPFIINLGLIGAAMARLCLAVVSLWLGLACNSMAKSVNTIEHWSASSTTAISITGNLRFEPKQITFYGGAKLALNAVGQSGKFKDGNDSVDAKIYKVSGPADPLLLNGNHLCGNKHQSRSITFIAIWHPEALPGDSSARSMAVYSNETAPNSTGGKGFCGLYNYQLSP